MISVSTSDWKNAKPSRREFLALSSAATALTGCSRNDLNEYHDAVARLRAPLSQDPDMAEFVRFATLAANGHNTQPWRFAIRDSGVRILPDFSRRTPVVDPDDHHLYVSLGCATENLLIAAQAHGRPGAVQFDGSGDGRIDIDLVRAAAQAGELYEAIPRRQSTRSEYDGCAVSPHDLRRLEAAAGTRGVSIVLITDEVKREDVLEFVVEGNNAQMDNPEFVRELRDSIRFNPSAALRTGDGLSTVSSGNPTMPSWLGRRIFSWFFTKDAENEKYTRQLRSSAGVAVFIGDQENKDHWIRVGRSFQRFALQATALGIRHAHINQPIEVPEVRSEFAAWLGAGSVRPDLVVRFGCAPPAPMSMRRPVKEIIVSAA
ncbi:MAG: hypothetical protein MI861_25455 [Pirellulales bacterium]|nr:hypothetical protein [Pirellulales bacterium]